MLQVFVRRKAQCLLDLESSTSSSSNPALTQLNQWSVEATAAFVCFGMGSPKRFGTLHSLNMENATLYQEPPPDDALDALLVRPAGISSGTLSLSCICSIAQAALVLMRQIVVSTAQPCHTMPAISCMLSGPNLIDLSGTFPLSGLYALVYRAELLGTDSTSV